MTTYRPMAEHDIDRIVRLGQKMHAESAFSALNYDKGKFSDLLRAYVAQPETHFSFVAEKDGALIGMLLGYVSDYFFGNDLIANEVVWYVDPDFRGGLTGLRLMREFESWSAARGVSEVYMGVSTGVLVDRTGDLLVRFGYKHVGGNYKRSVVG